ncbi:MAG: hypothetical protein V4850_34975 [Myxococcota bacterium]
MSWLERAARDAGYRSIRKLAEEVSSFPGAPSFNSVNVHLGKLDDLDPAGIEWLRKRTDVLLKLAVVLGWNEATLRERIGAAADDDEATSVLIPELDSDRRWDLRADPLFPGVPARVAEPAAWRRLWWHAEAGSGAEWVGRWLRCNHEIQVVRERDWARARAGLRPGRPAFVVLAESTDAEALLRADGLEGWQICVVAAFAPPEPAQGPRAQPGPWEIVRSAPTDHWAGAFFVWAERFYGDGQYTASLAQEVWEKFGSATNFRLPGDLMALCGLLDGLGRDLLGADIEKLGDQWLKWLAARPAVPRETREWVKREGWSRVRALAEASLAETGPHDLAGWTRLGGEETVGRLRELGVLASEAADTFDLAPRWFARWTHWAATRQVVEDPARLRAASLASPEAILQRLQKDTWGPTERAIATLDAADPGSVAALELCFRAVGAKLLGQVLRGGDLHLDLLTRLWEAQGRVAVSIRGVPHPRLGRTLDLLPRWWESAWLISGLLYEKGLAPEPWPCDPAGALVPWRRPWSASLDAVVTALDDAPGSVNWLLGVTILRDVPGTPARRITLAAHLGRAIRRAEPVEALVAMFRPGDLATGLFSAAMFSQLPEEGEETLSRPSADEAASMIALAVWAGWRAVDFLKLLGADIAAALPTVVRALPAATWDEPASGSLLAGLLAWRATTAELPIRAWQAAVKNADGLHDRLLPRSPPLAIARALDTGGLEAALNQVWLHSPEAARAALARRVDAGDAAAVLRLLVASPPQHVDESLTVLAPIADRVAALPGASVWAWERVSARDPGWRQVWGWL